MILDWFQLSMIDFILIGILLSVFIIQLFFYLYYYSGVIRKSRRIQKESVVIESEKPPVTIIICARDQAKNLAENLPSIFNQDYPEFQVVVVNDASTDDTENVLVGLEQRYPNLYHTFVPQGVQSVSAKKMAMTLGIKAAKYDLLLFTEANCVPEGKNWITSMMGHFDDKCGIVLGFSSYSGLEGILKYLISYDTLFTTLQFMGFAEAGKPYMGLGRNLAYRKDLFFKNRGFANHLYLNSGDDDLFIGEVANASNTHIEITPESKVRTTTDFIWSHWKEQKTNHIATSAYYKAGTKFRTGTEAISRFLFYASFVALFIFGLIEGNFVPVILSSTFFILRYMVQLFVLNKSAKCLEEPRLYLSIPFFDLLLPCLFLCFRVGRIFHKENNYTWQVLH